MYAVYRVRDVVRIPPSLFDVPLEEAAREVLYQRYLGYVDPDLGIIVAIYNIHVDEHGRILPGDGATYHDTEFDILAFKPVEKEVVEGSIVSVQDFGVFVNLGPIDGFIHKSQIMDEEMRFDAQRGAFIGIKTGRIIEKGDVVRARIIAISLPREPTRKPKIQLTMRQPMLGKVDWIREEVAKIEETRRKARKTSKG